MPPTQQWTGLAGSTAVVTGAAGGLGLVIAQLLLDHGMRVVLTDLDKIGLDNAVTALKDRGQVVGVVADVASDEGIESVKAAARDSDARTAVWINNAGIVSRTAAEDLTSAEWDRVMAVNLRSVFLGSQAAHSLMPDGGSIVNMSSIMGTRTYDLRAAYGTSKAAVTHLTRSLAHSWGPYGIRVNAVAPGFISTKMSAWLEEDPTAQKKVYATIPMRRMGTPDEVAQTVLFLSSSVSSYITGQVIHVDGGWST